MAEKSLHREEYFPRKVGVKIGRDEVILIDDDLDGYENADLCTFGSKETDLSQNMIREFAESLVDMINEKKETADDPLERRDFLLERIQNDIMELVLAQPFDIAHISDECMQCKRGEYLFHFQ